MRTAASKFIVLDRDGTLVVDRGYLSDPAGLEFLPGAAEGLRVLCDQGFRLVVATNQSGVGRGMFSLDQLREMNIRLTQMVNDAGARLEGIYSCPHAPEFGCSCRKPETGLLLQAASELGFVPSSSVVVGDKITDIEFGRRVGANTILLSSFGAPADATVTADFTAADLLAASRAIFAIHSMRTSG
jgi:D-glycero-D-manno-heptose 1,7-bisphosphate phosphatase